MNTTGTGQPLPDLIRTQSAHYGSLIRRAYGEPFWTDETMEVETGDEHDWVVSAVALNVTATDRQGGQRQTSVAGASTVTARVPPLLVRIRFWPSTIGVPVELLYYPARGLEIGLAPSVLVEVLGDGMRPQWVYFNPTGADAPFAFIELWVGLLSTNFCGPRMRSVHSIGAS